MRPKAPGSSAVLHNGARLTVTLAVSVLAGCSVLPSTSVRPLASPGGGAAVVVPQTLLVEPDDGLGVVYSFISRARASLDMTMYELADPTAEHDLVSDVRRGVHVRVLLDEAYSGAQVNAAAFGFLEAHGVDVRWGGTRTIFHQKTITVDDRESLIMTGNLTARYYRTDRDFGVFDSDATDVADIVNTFDHDFSGDPPATEHSANLVWSPGSEAAMIGLIRSARHVVYVENEEMDSYAIEEALESDAERGITVDVTMTSAPEWDSALDRLLASGVSVHTYGADASLYLHAKVISIDPGSADQRAFVGSQNFSTASLEQNRELGMMTTSRGVLRLLDAVLESDYAR